MSIKPGVTHLPRPSTRVAPAGIGVADPPTARDPPAGHDHHALGDLLPRGRQHGGPDDGGRRGGAGPVGGGERIGVGRRVQTHEQGLGRARLGVGRPAGGARRGGARAGEQGHQGERRPQPPVPQPRPHRPTAALENGPTQLSTIRLCKCVTRLGRPETSRVVWGAGHSDIGPAQLGRARRGCGGARGSSIARRCPQAAAGRAPPDRRLFHEHPRAPGQGRPQGVRRAGLPAARPSTRRKRLAAPPRRWARPCSW